MGSYWDSLDPITTSIDTVLYSNDFELPKLALGGIPYVYSQMVHLDEIIFPDGRTTGDFRYTDAV